MMAEKRNHSKAETKDKENRVLTYRVKGVTAWNLIDLRNMNEPRNEKKEKKAKWKWD